MIDVMLDVKGLTYQQKVVAKAKELAIPGSSIRNVSQRVAACLQVNADHVRKVLRAYINENPSDSIFVSKEQFREEVIDRANVLDWKKSELSCRRASELIAQEMCGDVSFSEKIRGILKGYKKEEPEKQLFESKKAETEAIVAAAIELNNDGVHRITALTTIAHRFHLSRKAAWARLNRYSKRHGNKPLLTITGTRCD